MAGYCTDIVSITVPSSAKYGDTVSVTVAVKNLTTSPIYIAVSGRYDGVDIPFPGLPSVNAGATYSFTTSFTMPDKSIKLELWSWYFIAAVGWILDDYEYVNIALAAVPSPQFSGFGITDYGKI